MMKERFTVELPDGQAMQFRLIPKGANALGIAEFLMGARGGYQDEGPIHGVRLSVPFYLGETPVTQAQYRVMAEACGRRLSEIEDNRGVEPSDLRGAKRPVEQVSWDDANAVCRWLTESSRLPKGWMAGLPTEAQWEYACRAGTDTEYHNGDGDAALRLVGWFFDNCDSTQEIGLLTPNDWGLFDMHGNVWEWCRDAFEFQTYRQGYSRREAGVLDPEVSDGPLRILRGGAFDTSAWLCRAAARDGLGPDFRNRFIGFRVGLFPGHRDREQPVSADSSDCGSAAGRRKR